MGGYIGHSIQWFILSYNFRSGWSGFLRHGDVMMVVFFLVTYNQNQGGMVWYKV